MVDLEFLQGLIEAIDRSGIDSLEITRAGTRIRVSKTPPPSPAPSNSGASTQFYAVPQAGGAPAVAGAAATGAAEAGATPADEGAPKRDDNVVEITSPMVGTFYRSPSPEAPPYVEVGSQVRKGQTLCILEAMKLMNELEAEVDGTIREILVENTDPVEFGQPLFLIEPAK
jgi:acetyl-CoA carboxylase biotin carboxyl carrier protein